MRMTSAPLSAAVDCSGVAGWEDLSFEGRGRGGGPRLRRRTGEDQGSGGGSNTREEERGARLQR